MTPDDIRLDVAPSNGKAPRLCVARLLSGDQHRDRIDTASSISRQRFVRAVANRAGCKVADLGWLENDLIEKSDEADARLDHDTEDEDEQEGQPSQATLLVRMAEGTELFHGADAEPFVRFAVGAHHEVSRLRNKTFKRWLSRRFYDRHERTPNSQALNDALGVLEGKAVFDGHQREVFLRVARHEDRLYIDLADDAWRAIEVDQDGWRIVEDMPVYFRRSKSMQPLPEPQQGGSVLELRRFVNIADEHWPLLLGGLVGAFKHQGPFPTIVFSGEQGSAKSTAARVLKSLIDPSSAPLRSGPREPRDLAIQANNGWFLCLDNLSHLQPWLSDILCTLATGGGFSSRTLYSDDDETIFSYQRPVTLNGITEIATRPDLLDRALMIPLPSIGAKRRIPEKQFWNEFNEARPRILGGLLNAVSRAIRDLPSVQLDRLPRMADFACWVSAAEPKLGLQRGEFLQAYLTNRDDVHQLALESSPTAKVLLSWLAQRDEWCGACSDLLQELTHAADERTRNLKSWPKTASSLSGVLRRLAPNLRHVGVEVDFASQGRGRNKRRVVSVKRDTQNSVPSAPSVPSGQNTGNTHETGDGVDGGSVPKRPAASPRNPKNHGEYRHGDGVDGGDGLLHTPFDMDRSNTTETGSGTDVDSYSIFPD